MLGQRRREVSRPEHAGAQVAGLGAGTGRHVLLAGPRQGVSAARGEVTNQIAVLVEAQITTRVHRRSSHPSHHMQESPQQAEPEPDGDRGGLIVYPKLAE